MLHKRKSYIFHVDVMILDRYEDYYFYFNISLDSIIFFNNIVLLKYGDRDISNDVLLTFSNNNLLSNHINFHGYRA